MRETRASGLQTARSRVVPKEDVVNITRGWKLAAGGVLTAAAALAISISPALADGFRVAVNVGTPAVAAECGPSQGGYSYNSYENGPYGRYGQGSRYGTYGPAQKHRRFRSGEMRGRQSDQRWNDQQDSRSHDQKGRDQRDRNWNDSRDQGDGGWNRHRS